MTNGQLLRHQISRLSLVKAMPRHGETGAKFVKFYESDIAMLTAVLEATARLLDDEGVPAQSWMAGEHSTRRTG